jgi:RNA polymerase sigma factor (sigma-70 family)
MSALNEQTPDPDLWRLVREGSVAAFELVVRRHQSVVCAVAYNACGDLALSEDIAQETFWAAWRQQRSLAEPNRLRAWLCGIARNLGHNAQRRASRRLESTASEPAADIPARAPSPVDEAAAREERALVWQTLEQIPELYREPLILFYREERSIAEVAAALDVSMDAAKQRLARGRGMIQERMTQVIEGALRRSRPGRKFTVTVMAGLGAFSAGTKTALAGTGAIGVAGPAAVGLGGSLFGALFGVLGGLVGGWLGYWIPAQVAATKPERDYLLRAGKRIFMVSILLTLSLTLLTLAHTWKFSPKLYLVILAAWLITFWTYVAVEISLILRAVKRIRAQMTVMEANDTPLRRVVDAVAARYRGRVFRSRLSFLGLPLLHVNMGDPRDAGEPTQRRVAHGWIAVGDEAFGVLFALGGRACGLLAVGGFAVGLIAVGGGALGVVAIGGCAGAGLAFGGLAIGWQAWGGLALAGGIACGGIAAAWHAAYGGIAIAHDYAVAGVVWANHANDAVAKAIVLADPAGLAFDWYLANNLWITPAFLLSVLAFCGAILPLLYRRETEN